MTRKTTFYEGWSWFKFNNLGLALGTNLKFYTSLSKRLKLKVRKFWGLIPTFVEITGEKLVGGAGLFAPPPSWIGLRSLSGVSLISVEFFFPFTLMQSLGFFLQLCCSRSVFPFSYVAVIGFFPYILTDIYSVGISLRLNMKMIIMIIM